MKYYSQYRLYFLLCFLSLPSFAQEPIIKSIKTTIPVVLLTNNQMSKSMQVTRRWQGNNCRISLTNTSKNAQQIKEIILFQANKCFAPTTRFYGEGFQMLAQNGGTLEKPEDWGSYSDYKHYRIPEPLGYRAVYNMLLLEPENGSKLLMGFNSSRRFIGKFYVSADTIKVVIDVDNITLKSHETIKLEGFSLLTGNDANELKQHLADVIKINHSPLKAKIPAGWCSWYCFGPKVTAQNIYDNLDFIQKNIPQLRYIQIDDGYQPHMGDWLETGKSFGGNIKEVLQTIKSKGFEPAIWVAPFICDSNSTIYKNHPDWLVKDENGQPLRSDKVMFGGWRLAPWYVLDGTHPEVQKHFTELFRTMRKQWGCTYFKLDANVWGTIRGGKFYRKNATRVEAYREGMQAILKGTDDAFVLGCNHPIWPSLGLIHGSRSSMDINRKWTAFKQIGRENLLRAWQNGNFWWNDPDVVELTGDLPDNEFMFHAALIYATGGMLLSGDDLTQLSAERLNILKKLVPPTAIVPHSDDSSFEVFRLKTSQKKQLILLNWADETKTFIVKLDKPCEITDYFTSEKLGNFSQELRIENMKEHFGRILTLKEK